MQEMRGKVVTDERWRELSLMSPEEAYGFSTAKPRPCLEGTLV